MSTPAIIAKSVKRGLRMVQEAAKYCCRTGILYFQQEVASYEH